MKYIVVMGGVVSGVGKGILASSTGVLLQSIGYSVTAIKVDPYLNVDAGTINPSDHGEVFVLEDGSEVDMDLGNYERFLGVTLTQAHSLTSGKIYQKIIEKERKGAYLGKTVQIIPHVTDAIQNWIERASRVVVKPGLEPEICIIEIGGTVGDIESAPFTEAMRQFQTRVGAENMAVIYVSLVPEMGPNDEPKTKPTQRSVIDLRGAGLNPDIIVCRSRHLLAEDTIEKISMFCQVPASHVLSIPDCKSIYHVPPLLHERDLVQLLITRLRLTETPSIGLLEKWKGLADQYDAQTDEIYIVMVGKYTKAIDCYISVVKALEHACLFHKKRLVLKSIDSEELVTRPEAWDAIRRADGIIAPGGFGSRGAEGIILSCRYARENRVPFLGICFGFQLAVVEGARNLLGLDAGSLEIDPNVSNPVIVPIKGLCRTHLGGTMKLGKQQFVFVQNGLAQSSYGSQEISERLRHRYQVNPEYIEQLENVGFRFVCQDTATSSMNVLELDSHPFFVATQFHPELQSRPLSPAPLFLSFICACSK